jgi:hypothetical protein
MKRAGFETIIVLAVFAGLRSHDSVHRVTPLRFRRATEEVQRIRKIRRVYRDQNGDKILVHFVVETETSRYFDIVYDPKLSVWKLVLEVDQELLFDRVHRT